MRLILALCAILLLQASAARAGVVEGAVLENASGRPLARTFVRLEPVPVSGGGGPRLIQIRTNRTGGFLISNVPAGLYTLVAQREGFLPVAYGQRRPAGQGIPFQVTGDSRLFALLRMARLGAITGRVLDENGVGLPGVTVLAYRARLPLRSVSSAIADDRGVYRIAGLPPGKYWVRTAARTLDDGSGILPTFPPRSREIRDTPTYEVRADAEVIEANVEPEPGNLFRLTGRVGCDRPDGTAVNVTLSSETGRRSTQAACGGTYTVEGLAPAAYEIFGVYADGLPGSGFVELQLDANSALGNVQLMAPPQIEFEVRNAGGSASTASVQVLGLRDDLSGEDQPRRIPTPRTTLAAGHWEFGATAGPGQYIQSIRTLSRDADRPWRNAHPPDWFEVFLAQRGLPRIQIIVADQAGQITGTVKSKDGVAAGSPVFLLPLAEGNRRSLGGPHKTVADTDGRYSFEGLPPGDYRLFASFEFSAADTDEFQEAQAISATAVAAQSVTLDLPLWTAP